MRQMHDASSLAHPEEVAAWRTAKLLLDPPAAKGPVTDLEPIADDALPRDPLEQVILRRGSTRQFARVSITLPQLSTLLDRATRGLRADFLSPAGMQWNDLYLIVNSVEGLAPGAYYYQRQKKQLELLKAGDFRQQAGYLGLEQELPADASVGVFFLADLHKITAACGNRGYRAVQLEAGVLGGKLYLAAYAQRLGATGLTFYDDDVVNFFSPHAKGKNAVFLVALGRSA
jgi:SagB-type dehydrogenase family enzyme